MKQRVRFSSLVLLIVSMAAFGRTPIGGDDFEDNVRSPTNWGDSFHANFGQLTEANHRLEFTSSDQASSNIDNFGRWMWNAYTSQPMRQWTYQMDVSMPNRSLEPGESTFFGFQVSNKDRTSFVSSYNFVSGSSHEFVEEGASTGPVSRRCTAAEPCGGLTQISDLTALRLRFDSTTDTLFTDFDPNGAAGGYTWVNLSAVKNFIPETIYVFGQSNNLAVLTSDDVYGDNILTTAIPELSTYLSLVLGIGVLGWVLTLRARECRYRPALLRAR
jgi:hypothetical protein